ncbi:MAG: leucine-rich repeat domain-containing protein, partial [Paludibacteraceae bacterium]|nr:leucine-rich repeat domain-containing protein [Paludibacteraceae bacterium]
GCSSLTSVTIPNSVTYIAGYAFSGCSSLTSVTIPNSVTSIGKYAFSECGSLTSITIPNSVTRIGEYAFSECGNLTSVTINSDAIMNKEYSYNTSITSIFGDQVTEYVLGNSITSIGSYAFYKISGLTSITIPNSVTSIGKYAFSGCSEIETISLGKSVQNIGAYAFGGCKRVTDIYCYAERVPDAVSGKGDSFLNISRKAYLWVPANRLRNYQTDEFWGEFDVRPMQAENANTDQVTIITESNAAEVIWPNISNADTYELTIKGNDGQTICTLIFNAEGQLQSIAFRAPAANGKPAPQATQATGFRFTVTGLEANTKYDYLINAKDVTDHIIETFQGEFTTDGGTYTDIENIASEQGNSDFKPHKVLENGQVIILIPDGRRYNMRGIEVR